MAAAARATSGAGSSPRTRGTQSKIHITSATGRFIPADVELAGDRIVKVAPAGTLHGDEEPSDVETLLALTGIGPYTARAVASFAFEPSVLISRPISCAMNPSLRPCCSSFSMVSMK